jgi:hypothetical protein
MERGEIENLRTSCPVVVKTVDGQRYIVEKFIVADNTTSLLFTKDGKKLHTVISHGNIASIEPTSPASQQ